MNVMEFMQFMAQHCNWNKCACNEVYQWTKNLLCDFFNVDDCFFEQNSACLVSIDGDIEGTSISGGDLSYDEIIDYLLPTPSIEELPF